MSRPQHFYFQAQSGRIEDRPIHPTNFHTYLLHVQHLQKVQEAVRQATLGSGGLEYPSEFVEWLAKNDQG